MVPSGNVRTTKRPAGLTAAILPVVARPGVTVTLGLALAVAPGRLLAVVPGDGLAMAGWRRCLPAQPATQQAQSRMRSRLIRPVKSGGWRSSSASGNGRDYTLPIHLRSSQTAFRDVTLRRSKMF